MAAHLAKWVVFGVMFALVPVFLKGLEYYGIGKDPELATLVKHGEFLLISVAITSAALGDILTSNRTPTIFRIICGGACSLLIFISAGWFSSLGVYKDLVNIENVRDGSSVILGCSVFASGFTIFLARK